MPDEPFDPGPNLLSPEVGEIADRRFPPGAYEDYGTSNNFNAERAFEYCTNLSDINELKTNHSESTVHNAVRHELSTQANRG